MEIVCGDLPLEGIRPNALQKKEDFRHSCEAGVGDCTAEARSKESLIKKFSDLCELGAPLW